MAKGTIEETVASFETLDEAAWKSWIRLKTCSTWACSANRQTFWVGFSFAQSYAKAKISA